MNNKNAQKFDNKLIKAIIGLGNPGSKYQKNRHNIGFRILDALAIELGVTWHKGDKMEYATVTIPDSTVDSHSRTIYLIKPQTFMNDSGLVVSFLQKKGIKPEEIIVAHDELEKPLGFTGVSFGGSAKGHNGLRSIMGKIGQDFWRLKFGIGRPDIKEEVPQYVLSNFKHLEEAEITELIEKALMAIGFWHKIG